MRSKKCLSVYIYIHIYIYERKAGAKSTGPTLLTLLLNLYIRPLKVVLKTSIISRFRKKSQYFQKLLVLIYHLKLRAWDSIHLKIEIQGANYHTGMIILKV